MATSRQYTGKVSGLLPVVVVVATGAVLRSVSPKFGKMVAEEANRKGYYRWEFDHIYIYTYTARHPLRCKGFVLLLSDVPFTNWAAQQLQYQPTGQ